MTRGLLVIRVATQSLAGACTVACVSRVSGSRTNIRSSSSRSISKQQQQQEEEHCPGSGSGSGGGSSSSSCCCSRS